MSWTHTNNGNYLVVATFDDYNTHTGIGTVTYNGVAMTQVRQITMPGPRTVRMWSLSNPAVGANTITASADTTQTLVGVSASYAGFVQAAPDANNVGSAGTQSSLAVAVTPAADKDWIVFTPGDSSNGLSVSNNLTLRASNSASGPEIGIADSNGPISPIAQFTGTASDITTVNWAGVIASFGILSGGGYINKGFWA